MLDTSTSQPAAGHMNIVIAGHVDHGKSTIIGRVLADTGSLPEGKLEQVRASCERNSRPFEYALLIDALKAEQAQNITIDAARVFFKTAKRHYLILDAPGHIEFVKNMVTGASRAEAALLVIDAEEGIQENSRRHGYLLGMLGIRQIVILVNKMDLVGWKQSVFESIRKDYTEFLAATGVVPTLFIPISGREGDNITAASEHMPWWKGGHTLLTALDSFEKEKPLIDKPFRMPVQDVYRFTMFGDDRRIVAGTIASGQVKPGDEITFYPSGKRAVVKTIEVFNRPPQPEAVAGQAVGLTLQDQIFIKRGEIVAHVQSPPRTASHLRVSLVWLGRNPMVPKKQYLLKLGTAKVKATIERIVRIVDASSNQDRANPDRIERHEVAECILSLDSAIACDRADDLAPTSRFVVVDDYEICGGGLVLEEVADAQSLLRDRVFTRNRKWIQSLIPSEQRSERYNQRPALVIITGPRGVGRKRLARTLEQKLFEAGKMAYYLGMGSILYGVEADIKKEPVDASQHEELIRRLAEVAFILMDAGLILIITAVELTRQDLSIIRTIIESNGIETVWVGDTVTTDIPFDIQLPGKEHVEESAVQIKRLLQDHGIIFSPR